MDAQLALFPDLAQEQPSERGAGPRAREPDVSPHPHDPAMVALGRGLPRGLRLGTSSWTFPGWSGLVYAGTPSERALARHGLRAYARHPLLRTVGLDRTFYRPIDAGAFARYAADVPDDFRFLVKADRRLTSPNDPEARAGGTNPAFLDVGYARNEVVHPALDGLGSKLGVLLFQLPPAPAAAFGGPDRFAERLARFLEALPLGPAYAVELRTPALFTRRYVAALEGAGASHGFVVHPAAPPLERQLALLQPHYQPAFVLRWMLHPGPGGYERARERYAPFDRVLDEDPATRGTVATAVLDALIAERTAWVVANNKAEGSSPLTLLGLAEHLSRHPGPDVAGGGSLHAG